LKNALLLIDLQNDFVTGSLPVPNAESIFPKINKVINYDWNMVIASQDWHPSNHISFKSSKDKIFTDEDSEEDFIFPDHCIQGTEGADFYKDFNTKKVNCIIRKGMNMGIDSFSAFKDNAKNEKTGLENLIVKQEPYNIFICGLALDYCVMYSAKDAKEATDEALKNAKVYVITDLCKAVDENKRKAILTAFKQKGIIAIESDEITPYFLRTI
jgi:nicotinamidase/pyrazinamidase